jgi:hypothetical protein
MDSSPNPQSRPQFSSLHARQHHHLRLVISFLIGTILSVTAIVMIGWYLYTNHYGQTGALHNSILVSVGQPQEAQLYTLAPPSFTTAKPFAPLSAANNRVLDYVSDATTTYYLIQSASSTSSNVYSVATKDLNALPTPLTYTATSKSELAYDGPAQELAFVDGTGSTSQVVLLNVATGVQKILGTGIDPTIETGGIMVLVRNGMALDVINSLTGKESTLLSIAAGAPFAISSDAKTLALYNPLAKTIDYFNISGILSASYDHSEKAPFAPSALFFSGTQLYLGGAAVAGSNSYEIQIEGNASPLAQFTLPAQSGTLWKLILI